MLAGVDWWSRAGRFDTRPFHFCMTSPDKLFAHAGAVVPWPLSNVRRTRVTKTKSVNDYCFMAGDNSAMAKGRWSCNGCSGQACGVGVGAFWGRLRASSHARTAPWLYTEPSTTRFRPVYCFCRSCYLKHALSSCHFLCLYTTVHLLSEEFIISLVILKYTISMSVGLIFVP